VEKSTFETAEDAETGYRGKVQRWLAEIEK
jgi:hypothetical protein